MKKIFLIMLVFPFILLNCLKAKRSPFDVSKPSPSMIGTITAILGRITISSTSNSPTTTATAPTSTSLLPSVTSTSPADTATGITANTPVIITFSMAMDKTSITTNSDDTTCSGTVQISFDNFATCVKMRSSISTTDNKTFTLSANPSMGTFATHKIKVTTNAKSDTSVKLATDYSHATGFTTSTPCTVYDAATCPIPFSTAATMTFSLGNGGMVIPIESGAAKGKIFVVNGSSTTTNIFNPETGIFSVGPNLTASVNQATESAYFFINSGSNSGKILIIHGVTSNTTSIYDPIANTMIIGPNLTINTSQHVKSFPILSGIHSGKNMVLVDGLITNIYDPTTNSFFAGPNLVNGKGNGIHSILINSGANIGKTLVVSGNNPTLTNIYDPATNSFSSGPTATNAINGGSHSFSISSGLQSGNILTVTGAGTNFSEIYNTTSNTFVSGPTIPGLPVGTTGASIGTHSIQITTGVNNGKIWLLSDVSNSNTYSTTSFYDPSTNTFSSGPNLVSFLTGNSKTVFIESGIYANKYMTFYGSKNFTSLYDPIKNAIDPSSILPSSAGNGINKVLLTSGSNSGKMLVINGGNNTSSLFDFASGTFSPGPNLTGVMGRSPGIFTISGGSQDGKTFVVHGGGIATTSIYDPVANSFSAGPALSANANQITSECIFKIPSGPQVGKYLIILSGVSQNTSLYDPSNNTIAAGPATGALIGLGATCFPIISGTHSGKFLVVQGFAGTGTRMYDPATNTFGAGPALTMNTTNGTFSMPITNGANNGKALIIIGTGTATNLYDSTTHTFSVGPNLSGSASNISPSSHLLLMNGTNKDKYLVMHDTTSSIYDPNTNTISAGLAIPNGGSLAFNITSGLFNQGVLLITGSGNLTNVVYP